MEIYENDYCRLLDDIRKEFCDMPRNRRAELIIRNYMSLEEVSEELRELFNKWLYDGDNFEYKCELISREFDNIIKQDQDF